jgi:hypothetical protein
MVQLPLRSTRPQETIARLPITSRTPCRSRLRPPHSKSLLIHCSKQGCSIYLVHHHPMLRLCLSPPRPARLNSPHQCPPSRDHLFRQAPTRASLDASWLTPRFATFELVPLTLVHPASPFRQIHVRNEELLPHHELLGSPLLQKCHRNGSARSQ